MSHLNDQLRINSPTEVKPAFGIDSSSATSPTLGTNIPRKNSDIHKN